MRGGSWVIGKGNGVLRHQISNGGKVCSSTHPLRRRNNITGRNPSKSARFTDFAAISARPPLNAVLPIAGVAPQ
jgi:hypothetical protein